MNRTDRGICGRSRQLEVQHGRLRPGKCRRFIHGSLRTAQQSTSIPGERSGSVLARAGEGRPDKIRDCAKRRKRCLRRCLARSVVFTRTENNVSHIYIAPADGTADPRGVLDGPGNVPPWSPDGKWISYSPNRGFSSGVSIVHPDGTGLRPVSENGGWAVWWP